jgi:hypothetical protein
MVLIPCERKEKKKVTCLIGEIERRVRYERRDIIIVIYDICLYMLHHGLGGLYKLILSNG